MIREVLGGSSAALCVSEKASDGYVQRSISTHKQTGTHALSREVLGGSSAALCVSEKASDG
jgi:hypothetical protein